MRGAKETAVRFAEPRALATSNRVAQRPTVVIIKISLRNRAIESSAIHFFGVCRFAANIFGARRHSGNDAVPRVPRAPG